MKEEGHPYQPRVLTAQILLPVVVSQTIFPQMEIELEEACNHFAASQMFLLMDARTTFTTCCSGIGSI